MINRITLLLFIGLVFFGCGSSPEQPIWIESEYVDGFGEKTSKVHIKNKNYFKGRFQDSATDGSTMNVRILIDEKDIAFKIYKYGYDVSLRNGGEDGYAIIMKVGDIEFEPVIAKNYHDRLSILPEYYEMVLSIMLQEEPISVLIKEFGSYSGYLSQYTFRINTKGFKELYDHSLKWMHGDLKLND